MISVLTIFSMVPGIIAMGIRLGAIYPDFRSENPMQSVMSFGGLIYKTLSMGLIRSYIKSKNNLRLKNVRIYGCLGKFLKKMSKGSPVFLHLKRASISRRSNPE